MDKKTIEKLRSDIRHYDEDDLIFIVGTQVGNRGWILNYRKSVMKGVLR